MKYHFARSLLCALALLLGVSSAHAEPTPWRQIGTHPVEGRLGNLDQLHERAHGLPRSEFNRGVAMQRQGRCERRQLRDGEVLFVSYYRNGRFGIEHKIVAFGDSVPLHDPRRTTYDCDLESGAAILLPDGCGNWSVQYRPKPQCRWERTVEKTYQPGMSLSTSGLLVPNCNCGDYTYLPGTAVTIPGSINTRETFERVCE